MAECYYCGARGNLVKAHVIPEAFFRPLRDGSDAPLLVSNVQNAFPKRAPIGVYDENILCGCCEARVFGAHDSYGADVFLGHFESYFSSVTQSGEVIAFQSSSVNKESLLRFLLSVLWRASISSQAFYSRIRLGPYEKDVKEVLSGKPISSSFDAVFSYWVGDGPHAGNIGLLNPHRERWNGVNAYRFYFGNVVAYVKVDKSPFPNELRGLGLQVLDGNTVLVARRFVGSKDFNVFVRVAKFSASTSAGAALLRNIKTRN